jgi:hypothetical protein
VGPIAVMGGDTDHRNDGRGAKEEEYSSDEDYEDDEDAPPPQHASSRPPQQQHTPYGSTVVRRHKTDPGRTKEKIQHNGTISLYISRNYAMRAGWGAQEGFRELIQNLYPPPLFSCQAKFAGSLPLDDVVYQTFLCVLADCTVRIMS